VQGVKSYFPPEGGERDQLSSGREFKVYEEREGKKGKKR